MTEGDVTVVAPAGAVADGSPDVTVSVGDPLGTVEGSFSTEAFGTPVGVEHRDDLAKPFTVSWHVPQLTDYQRKTLVLARWDEENLVWVPSDIQPAWDGDTVSAKIDHFSFWDWIADVGQAAGEWTGTRTEAPACSGKKLPAWIDHTVDPDEDTSAAAIRVCFEPDKDEVATVRVANNRTFTQRMVMTDGDQKWKWTWPGEDNLGPQGAVYSVAHAVLDSGTSYILPPVHAVAVGIDRPASSGSYFIKATAQVDVQTVLVDVVAFAVDQLSIGGTDNPLLDAFLQATYECGGKSLLAGGGKMSARDMVAAVVPTVADCAEEIMRPDSEFGKRFEDLSRKAIASSKLGAAAAVKANRVVHALDNYAKVLTVGELVFYLSDQFANSLVGPLSWSIQGRGRPQTLGSWKPSCSDLKVDSNALYKNLALQDQFADTSKDLWQFSGWQKAAAGATKPLKACPAAYLTKLAGYLPTSWGDAKAAQVVADTFVPHGGVTAGDLSSFAGTYSNDSLEQAIADSGFHLGGYDPQDYFRNDASVFDSIGGSGTSWTYWHGTMHAEYDLDTAHPPTETNGYYLVHFVGANTVAIVGQELTLTLVPPGIKGPDGSVSDERRIFSGDQFSEREYHDGWWKHYQAAAQPLRTATVPRIWVNGQYSSAGGTFTIKIWAQSETGDCASILTGQLAKYVASHYCTHPRRILASTTIDGRPVALSVADFDFGQPPGWTDTGTGSPPSYGYAADFRALATKDGTGDVRSLLDDGHTFPGSGTSRPGSYGFDCETEDGGAEIAEAWYLDGPSPENDPPLIDLAKSVYLNL